MNQRAKYTALIGVACLSSILGICGSLGLTGRGKLVEIRDLIRPPDPKPLESPPEQRFAELAQRARSHAAKSPLSGKSVIVQGFCEGPHEGLSLSTTTSWDTGEAIMIKLHPDFGASRPGGTLSRLISTARWVFGEPVIITEGDCVKAHGIYHATGYSPGTLLENTEWLEVKEIEQWDRGQKKWRKVHAWW
jgi:hypothetical protein